ncbi:MAG: hypothetical protein A2Z04_09600 [Chloroflexi bacterium RBG_16_57_9]|nr:MAG: hypothetical protein A2Z04_09600 [Chloroflexi bacterium RBG_16_57_9]
MARKGFVLELGSGADLRGGDSTKAAIRAVQDAIHRSSLFVLDHVDDLDKVFVDVTVAVPQPETVRTDEVLQVLPVGRKSIQVVAGGLAVPYRVGGSEEVIVANAAVRVSLEV